MKSSTPPPASGRTSILSQQSRSRISNLNNGNDRPSRFNHMTMPAIKDRITSASEADETMKEARKAVRALLDKGGPEAQRLRAKYQCIPADPETMQREIDALAGEYQQDESDSESHKKHQSTECEQKKKKASPGHRVHSNSEKGSVTSISPPTHKEKGHSYDKPSKTPDSGNMPRDSVRKSSASQGSGSQGRAPSDGKRPPASQTGRKPPTGPSGSPERGNQVGGSAKQGKRP